MFLPPFPVLLLRRWNRLWHEFIISLLSFRNSSHTFQEEEILAKRASRITGLEHHLSLLEEQLEDHNSGERELPADRLGSLMKRISVYEEQLAKYTRVLTQEVG